jgi:P-loop Domain of unknown function (DUF2791)
MTAAIPVTEWVDVLDSEYLSSFIPDGGASVKFAVPLGGGPSTLTGQLGRVAAARDLLLLEADASQVKLHMIDQLFFHLSAQVPWKDLARAQLFRLAAKDGYHVDPQGSGPVEQLVAAANDIDAAFVRGELRRRITQSVFKDQSLAKDFRVAMTQLCLSELSGGDEGATTSRVILDWLTGRNRAVSAVKPYEIRARIMRTNARLFIESLLSWVRSCGRAGTVLVLDINRLAVSRNPRDEQVFYAKAALLDTYEVLRQFVDATDRLEGCLLIVVASLGFLDTEAGTRGMGAYEALMFRVYDEIRDRELPNPMASLVRLAEEERV